MTSILPAILAALLLVQQAPQLPPPPRGFGTAEADVVVDAAGALPAPSVARINRVAFDVHARSGGEIAVVTLRDIGGRMPYEVAVDVGRAWGVGGDSAIGSRARNAGVVILIVPKETAPDGRGRCFVGTGQGAEGFITDAEGGDMCREAVPLFQARNYGGAAELLALRTAQHFAREFGFALDTATAGALGPLDAPSLVGPGAARGQAGQRPQRRGVRISPFMLMVGFFIVMMIFNSMRGGRGRGRGRGGIYPIILPPIGGGGSWGGGWGSGGGWGGGGGGGGFGGFGGGGGFSGGGGGSDW